ncbi:MAG TPA: biosynthetic arginine decarboxylase [Kiritimatiellia bacterium]|nr:biosynthetic arginine decarboxylase [Kiritimatiellia bacterium]
MTALESNGGSSGSWSYRDAAEWYGIRGWGSGYFDVSPAGEVTIHPQGPSGPSVSLMKIVSGLHERGMDMPVLLRIENILASRIKLLHETFASAIREFGYKNEYRGVYPIKVNQQEQVVENIVKYGAPYHHGLEAGSKAELIAAMSFLTDPEAFLICNGYKDEEFIDLGLYAVKMGIQCVFVLESPGELGLILERAKALQVKPILGVRIKLSSQAGGHWAESGGDRSVFGLNAAQVIDVVDQLRAAGMLDCLKLLHYHLGSQIPNIRDIREAVVEACRYYVGLVKEGAPMGILDLGGGLAVDYDGTRTASSSSRNYGLNEYCADIIEVVMTMLDEEDVAHPVIVTESGRATVAYYSVLLFNILDVSSNEKDTELNPVPEDAPEALINLYDTVAGFKPEKMLEMYHDGIYYRDEIRQLFKHGAASLRQRAQAEEMVLELMEKVVVEMRGMNRIPEELEGLESALSDVYYGNFSVFQSLPDAWAIDQLFPVMPIHRLNENPTQRATLTDITCDCDGKLDQFIGDQSIQSVLRVHTLKDNEQYYLGVFLVGAYQETLGDLHNLLGDTNVMSIRIDENGEVHYSRETEGDSVSDVLSYVEYETKGMLLRVRETAERAVSGGRITAQERKQILDAYESGLRGYTYFEA